MQQYREVELDVVLPDRVVDLVEEGFDLAIRISRGGSATYAARKLATARNILCVSPQYLLGRPLPRKPADLREHVCLGYTYAQSADEWHLQDAAGGIHVVKVHCHMHSNNGDTVRAAALAGSGIIWQPAFLIGEDVRMGRLVELLPGYRVPELDVLAVYPSRRQLSAKVRVMVDVPVLALSGATPPWEAAGQ